MKKLSNSGFDTFLHLLYCTCKNGLISALHFLLISSKSS